MIPFSIMLASRHRILSVFGLMKFAKKLNAKEVSIPTFRLVSFFANSTSFSFMVKSYKRCITNRAGLASTINEFLEPIAVYNVSKCQNLSLNRVWLMSRHLCNLSIAGSTNSFHVNFTPWTFTVSVLGLKHFNGLGSKLCPTNGKHSVIHLADFYVTPSWNKIIVDVSYKKATAQMGWCSSGKYVFKFKACVRNMHFCHEGHTNTGEIWKFHRPYPVSQSQ